MTKIYVFVIACYVPDVNECLSAKDNKCSKISQDCFNYQGGYNCSCKAGWKTDQNTKWNCTGRPLMFKMFLSFGLNLRHVRIFEY